jgi:hypothetical protein
LQSPGGSGIEKFRGSVNFPALQTIAPHRAEGEGVGRIYARDRPGDERATRAMAGWPGLKRVPFSRRCAGKKRGPNRT